MSEQRTIEQRLGTCTGCDASNSPWRSLTQEFYCDRCIIDDWHAQWCPFPEGQEQEGWPTGFVSLADYERLTAELEALIHDIERHIAIASELATENDRLRAALERISRFSAGEPGRIAREARAGTSPPDSHTGTEVNQDRPEDRPADETSVGPFKWKCHGCGKEESSTSAQVGVWFCSLACAD